MIIYLVIYLFIILKILIVIDKGTNGLLQKHHLLVNFSHKTIVVHDVDMFAS